MVRVTVWTEGGCVRGVAVQDEAGNAVPHELTIDDADEPGGADGGTACEHCPAEGGGCGVCRPLAALVSPRAKAAGPGGGDPPPLAAKEGRPGSPPGSP